ncbi:MAG: Ig-like domain-containing protein, partial [Actinobacteria bacterium]|nr:Ig-like domain-containing protein [Actinomycetota bacterium]
MYTIDNGGNAGWGAPPVNEGPQGTCTNQPNEPGTSDDDSFQLVLASKYGGHPNPTRGNRANTFNTSKPQSPVSVANPVECDYRANGPEKGNIHSFTSSTNGITEYTATNFSGAMKDDFLAASFDNTIYRVKLNSTGTGLVLAQALFSTVDITPLDLTAVGDTGAFPGTIWVGDIESGLITVFEPNDYGGGGGPVCTGANDPTLDEDRDGYTNADEISNGTNPCSAGDVPPDWDGDKISNLNDPNDDNDSRTDSTDPFAIDPNDGTTTTLPVRYTWDNNAPAAGGILNLGFTGLMTNGVANYESLYDATKMTAGGAAGVTTVDQVSEGTALGATNTQEYGFQFGVKTPASGAFTAHTRVLAPFSGLTPQDNQSMGLSIGTGDQSNYAKIVTSSNGGAGGIQFLKEVGGTVTARPQVGVTLPGPDSVDLYLTVDPVAATVQPSYAVNTGGTAGPRVLLGGPEPVPASWLGGASGLAVGLISTSAGPAPPFPATWDLIEVTADAAAPDTTPPTLTSRSPSAGATGVARSTNVGAVFSEAMDATTITASSVTLVKQGTTTPVPASIGYD